MMTNNSVQQLIDQLYNCISFAKGEELNLEKLQLLFVDGAIVIEYSGEQWHQQVKKNIESHIEEFKKVLEDYPVIKENGFNEKELHNQIMISGPMAFVQSQYEKNTLMVKIT